MQVLYFRDRSVIQAAIDSLRESYFDFQTSYCFEIKYFGELIDLAEFLEDHSEFHYALFLLILSFVKIAEIIRIVETVGILNISLVEQMDFIISKVTQLNLNFIFSFATEIH